MIIKNIKNTDRFFKTIEKCKGRVELVTKDGDRLNLKSKLSQYVSLSNMFSDPQIEEIELLVSEPSDVALLLEFLVQG